MECILLYVVIQQNLIIIYNISEPYFEMPILPTSSITGTVGVDLVTSGSSQIFRYI